MNSIRTILAALAIFTACSKKDSAAPENLYAITAIATFDRLVSDRVIRIAARNYAERLKHARASYRNDDDARDATTSARFAVFEAHLGPDWYHRIEEATGGPDFCEGCWGAFYVSQIEAWRQHALDTARDHLRDPARLRATYARHKSTIVDELRAAGVSDVAKHYLRDVILPYFTEEIPDDLWYAEEVYRAASLNEIEARMDMDTCTETCTAKSFTACEYGPCSPQWERWSESVGAKNNAEQTLWAATDDWHAFEFMLRRNAEGGDELVAAWGEILTDLEASLP